MWESGGGKLFYEVAGNPLSVIKVFTIRDSCLKLKKSEVDVVKKKTDKEIKQFILDKRLLDVTECMAPDL